MRYFPKFSFYGVSFIIAVLFFSVILMPALSIAGQFRVAVVPWSVNGPDEFSYLGSALTDMISSRVGSSDLVEIVRKDLVLKEAGKYKLKDIGVNESVKLGKALGADFLIYGSVSVLGDSVSIDAKISNVDSASETPLYATGIGIASIVKMTQSLSSEAIVKIRLEGASIKPDLSYVGKFKAGGKKGAKADDVVKVKVNATRAPGVEPGVKAVVKKVVGSSESEAEDVVVITRRTGSSTLRRRSSNVNGLFVSMTRADLDGDGSDEIFVVSKDKLIVMNFGIEGLSIIKEFNFPVEVQNLFLSSGDIDNDGKDEVYLARLTRGRPESVSVRFNKTAYSVNEIKGLRYLLRAVEVEGGADLLLAQSLRVKSGFYSKIFKIKKDGDKYTKNGRLKLPKSVARSGISNFQFVDIDKDGAKEIVTLGKQGNLTVFKAEGNGKYREYWRSVDTYGGSLNELVEYDPTGVGDSVKEHTYFMASEIKYGDFDSDGVNEIMIIRNIAGGLGKFSKRVLYYESGSLSRLYWNVALYDEEWKTKDISGYIADFIVSDLDGDGTKEVTMLVVENFGNKLKDNKMRSYLLSYSIQ